MQYLIKISVLAICLTAFPAPSQAIDVGVYPDSGCTDGVCCLVLPNWDGGYFDADKISDVRDFLKDPIGWSQSHGGRGAD